MCVLSVCVGVVCVDWGGLGAVLGRSWAAGCADRAKTTCMLAHAAYTQTHTHTQIEGACFFVQVLL